MPTILLPGPLSQNHAYVSKELTGRVYSRFMESYFGGKTLMKALGTESWKNTKVLADEPERFEGDVFIGADSNTFTIGRRRALVKARTVDGNTEVDISITKSSGMQIALVLAGLCMCMVPGFWYMFRGFRATRRHRGILEELKGEILQNVQGAKDVTPAA